MESTDPISMTYGQISDLVNRIEQIPPLTGTGAPTTSTPAWYLGQRYIDTQSNNEYYCVEIPSSGVVGYVWQPVDTSTSYTGGDGINIDAQNVISATNTGKTRALTTDDYNANRNNWTDTDPANFNCIALWKLDAGVYSLETGLSGTRPVAYLATRYNITNNGPIWIGESRNGDRAISEYLYYDGNWKSASAWRETGEIYGTPITVDLRVVDNLTSVATNVALSANQGRVLKGLIDAIEVPTKTSDLTNDADYQTGSQVSTAIGVETTARQNADVNLQGQIDAIVASSDVKDIVGTKAELNAYDTSTLGDKDIIKVLQDESEDNATTYYRWSTSTSTFTLIGEEGPYYTKAEADTLLNAKANASTTYTKSEVDTALSGKVDNSTLNDYATTAAMNTALAGKADASTTYTKTEVDTALDTKADASTTYTKTEVDTALAGKANTADVYTKTQVDTALDGKADAPAAGTTYVTDTAMATALAEKADVSTTYTKTEVDTALSAKANTADIPAVVQTTGTSQTDVMSQNAVTSMVFADPSTRSQINIATNYTTRRLSVSDGGIQIGRGSYSIPYTNQNVYISPTGNMNPNGSYNTVIGYGVNLGALIGAIALGAYSNPTHNGEMSIGSTDTHYGYNSSNYRLLTGLYDPQSDHDAATKGYVDASITTAISGIVGVEFEVVQTLPATGDAGTIYLVPNQGTAPNIYDEYIYVNNAFEKIGTTEIDLSNYVTTTDLNTALANYTTTANLATVATTGDYNDLINTPATFTTNEWNALWA